MSILRNLGKAVAGSSGNPGAAERLLRASGRGISRVGDSKLALGAIGLGAFGLGVGSVAGPAARDATFDVAFGDPNADVAFTGRKLDARYLVGNAMGGVGGGALKMSAPGDYLAFNPPLSSPMNVGQDADFRAGAIGGGIGMVAGGVAGRLLTGTNRGAAVGASIFGFLGGTGAMGSVPSAFASTGAGAIVGGAYGLKRGRAIGGAMRGLGSGLMGSVAGAGAGAALGGAMIAGSVAPGMMAARSYANSNQQFFQESPYSGRSSFATASALNASGDIVLGMHNSRRGY